MDNQLSIQQNQYPEIGSTEERKKISGELKSARDFNEMSLDQIRAISKINTVYLENLEAGNWSFLPAVYVKLFIIAYAQIVGIYNEEFQNRLDEVFLTIQPIARSVEHRDFFSDSIGTGGRSRSISLGSWFEKNRALFLPGILVVAVIVVIIVYLAQPPKLDNSLSEMTSAHQNSTAQVTETRVDTVKQEVIPPQGIQPVVVEEPKAETFDFGLMSSGTCYVKIEHQDSVLYDRTLWPDNVIALALPEPIKLTLGNAPEIRLIISGDTLDAFPEDRKVRVFRINRDGIIQ